MTRVRCYYRYSSDEQTDGWSIEAQDKACRAFAATRPDWTIDAPAYVDEAWSGKTVHRPAFQQMLADAQAGQFDVLVCHKLDRFSRSLVDVLLTLDELQKCKVSFASASENIDFTTPSGRMMLVMLAFFAEWYLQNLSAETTKGKVARFESGYWNGDLRFGYSKEESGEETKAGKVKKFYKPVPNADAKYVAIAYELGGAGVTDQEISDELNRAGSRTYRLIKNAKKKAGPDTDLAQRRVWTKDSVASLFSREASQFYLGNTPYIGEKERTKAKYSWQIQIRYGTHEALITQEQHDRAMTAREKRRNPGRVGATVTNRVYLMGEGIAHCVRCGRPMRCTNSKCGRQLLYYRCASHLRGETCEGSNVRVQELVLLPQLDEYINVIVLPDEWQDRVREQLKINDQRDQITKRRDSLHSQLRRLNYQFEQGLFAEEDIPEYKAKAQRLIREINSLTIPSTDKTLDLGDRLIGLPSAWGRASEMERHEILKDMFEVIYLDTSTKQLVGVKPYAEFVPLFRQTSMIEVEGVFMVRRDPYTESLIQKLGVSHGSDGIGFSNCRWLIQADSDELVVVFGSLPVVAVTRKTAHVPY